MPVVDFLMGKLSSLDIEFFIFLQKIQIDIGTRLFRNKNYINWCGSVLPCHSLSGSASEIKCRKYTPSFSTQIIVSTIILLTKNQGSLAKRMNLGLEYIR